MSATLGRPAIRRIVITLEASRPGRAALEAAVRLATALGAELEGVFVEDINLIRLSELPFLRQLRAWSLVEEQLSTQGMQRDLRALAHEAERMFSEATQTLGAGCSFRVWRGHTTVETLTASFEADVLSLAGARGSLVRSRPLLQTGPLARAAQPEVVNVLFSASPAAERALVAACNLARSMAAAVRVLIAGDTKVRGELAAQVDAILTLQNQPADRVQLGEDGVPALVRAVRQAGDSTVLLADVAAPLLLQAGLSRCLEKLPCPVFFVR